MSSECLPRYDAGEVHQIAAVAMTSGECRQLPDGRAAYVGQLRGVDVGDAVNFKTSGIVEVPKTASINLLQGGDVYFDSSTNRAHFAPGNGRFRMGVAVEDSLAAATTVLVDLNAVSQPFVDTRQNTFSTVIVKTAGTPSITQLPGGAISLAFSATNEAQKVDLLSNLAVPVSRKFILRARLAVFDIGDNAALDLSAGVANGTHASDADAITESAFLHMDGTSLDIKVESDDGTTEVNATDTTVDAVDDTYFDLWIDCRDLTAVKFYLDGVRVLSATAFKLDKATGPLKALIHLEKTADDTPGEVRVQWLTLHTFD
jgi:predicted RecA/RadA family phage recombinase